MDTFGPPGRRLGSPTGLTNRPRRRATLLMATLALFGAGCRAEMYDQPRYEPYEPSASFHDGTSSRPIVSGTVPATTPYTQGGPSEAAPTREAAPSSTGEPGAYEHLYQGMVDGELATTFPFEIQRQDLVRGQERYMVYCSPCHGAAGDGRGMIVQRGFPPPPPLYGPLPAADTSQAAIVYSDLREAPAGHFFEVITNGHGAMYSYKARVAPEDRWRIIAYIRALQQSQYAPVDALDPADIQRINNATSEEQDLLREARR